MSDAPIERQTMETDIVCTGFGPATAGFLATIAPHILNPDGTPAIESPSMPGMPLQVMCYERADGVGFTVSGVVTRARGIRAALPDAKLAEIPMATPVTAEKVVYLLDPVGASRRSAAMRTADAMVRTVRMDSDHAIELPYTPPFLEKHGGWVFSLGQFLQHVGNELMATGTVQVWPGMPVAEALLDDKGERVCGVRLVDQGVDREGRPDAGFMPGMDIRAALTVVGDGPVGAVGRQLDKHFGLPRRASPARMGAGHEDGGGSAARMRPRGGHGDPHVRLPRAGDLRLPLRACRTAWPRWAFSCRPGSAAPCAPPTATCSITCCTRICGAI